MMEIPDPRQMRPLNVFGFCIYFNQQRQHKNKLALLMRAVVQHGGAGTTTMAARAGAPSSRLSPRMRIENWELSINQISRSYHRLNYDQNHLGVNPRTDK